MSKELKPRYRWVILALAWLIYFSFGLIMSSLSALIIPIMRDLDLAYTQMGLIAGAWPLVYIFIAYLNGLLIDVIGPYRSLFIGVAVIALSEGLRGIAVNFLSLFVAVGIFGFGGSLISVGLPKLIASWFTGEERGTASGVYATGPAAGGMVGLMITNSFVLPAVGTWRNVFLLYGLLGFLVSIIWLLLGRRPLPTSGKDKTEKIRIFDVMRILLKLKNVWVIIIVGVGAFMLMHSFSAWLPTILELNGMTPALAGFTTSISSLFGIIGSLIIPRASYLVGSKKLTISFALFITGIAIFINGTSGGLTLWVGIVLFGLFQAALMPMLLLTLMEIPEVGSKYMGMAGGIFFTFVEVGGFLGPLITGYIKDVTSSFYLGIIFLTVVAEVMIIPTIFLEEKKELTHEV